MTRDEQSRGVTIDCITVTDAEGLFHFSMSFLFNVMVSVVRHLSIPGLCSKESVSFPLCWSVLKCFL